MSFLQKCQGTGVPACWQLPKNAKLVVAGFAKMKIAELVSTVQPQDSRSG
jgi:hypothetical protein